MSGTSLDGLDMVYVKFNFTSGKWSFDILDAQTLDYNRSPGDWKTKLKSAYNRSPQALDELNIKYAQFLGNQAKDFLDGRAADFIGSHGHTIHHQPDKGITYQLGNHQAIAETSGITTIGNFRVQDVRLGGQGAPLVPIGDQLLFRDYDYCLNLGGFSNISFSQNETRIAFDLSPCNMLLNQIAELLDHPYDEGGELAMQGNVKQSLLQAWNSLEYYNRSFPKSLGREWYEHHFKSTIGHSNSSPQDLMATAVEHIAIQIGKVLKKGKCLTTGGGAKNSFLIGRLRDYSNAEIVIPSESLVDFKEAVIFALLGVLKAESIDNVLASVTGASHDHCSGVVYEPAIVSLI